MATTVTLKPNAIDLSGSTSGTTTLQATAVAGTTTVTLPAATDTLVGKATTDTLTNKTLTSPTITGGALNGTLGATTPSTVAATSITASTTLGVTGTATLTVDASISGLTVGKGGGSVTQNTVVGASVGAANTTGKITAVGYLAARFNTTGSGNTALGGNDAAQDGALYYNTTGNYNIAVGTGSVASNTTGSSNTGIGYSALQNNTTASNNTAVGYQAGYSNTTGQYGAFLGYQAGYSSSTTSLQTCIGYQAGYGSTGSSNTFVGNQSGVSMTTGSKNTILGAYNGNQGGLDIRTTSNYIVLSDGDGNPRIIVDNGGDVIIGGTTSSATAKLNVYQADSSQRVVHFENTRNVSGDENLRLVLGTNCNNTSSYSLIVTTAGADKLMIYGNGNVQNTNNSYGAISDIKLKENIVDATPKLADLMQVKVRNYNLIGDTTKQIGVVAQELETVFPAMIDESPDRDDEGGNLGTVTKSVKYSVFVPMLIKAIQELKAEFDAYKATHP